MMWKIVLTFFAAVLAVGSGQGVPGGATPIDSNDPGFQVALRFAVVEYNHHSNHHHYYGLVQVLSSKAQIVAGINYIMTVVLGKTDCPRFSDGDNCPVITDSPQTKYIYCNFTVWSRPWINDMRLTGASCWN